jgi:hypothetical protein
MRARRLPWLLVVVGLNVGCEKPAVRFDLDGIDKRLPDRIEQALSRPSVNRALDDFMEALAADPTLERAAAPLAVIVEDPRLVAVAETFLGRMQDLPNMQALVRETIATHPKASPEELGELVGKDVEKAFESAQLDAVFDELGVQAMTGRSLDLLMAAIGPRLEPSLARHEARWSKRVIELNGGATPSPARATELYLEHAWSAARVETFALAILANPTVRRETAKLCAATLEVPAVVAELRRVTVELAQDTELQARGLEVLSQLLARPRDEAAVAAATRKLVMSAQVTAAVRGLIAATITQPEVGRAAGAALDTISADPAAHAAMETLIDGW